MTDEFGSYARRYPEIINLTSAITGEKYEFFIRFRVSLMKRKLTGNGAHTGINRILDFGCGIGAAGKILEDAFPQAAILGVDSSEKSVIEANHQGLSRSDFICSEGEALPLADASVDLVYSNGVVHHTPLERRGAVLRELFRVVRPKGQVFIFENNPANPLMMRAMAKSPLDSDAQPITPKELSRLFENCGFRIARSGYYFLFPHCLRFLRWGEPLFEQLPLGAQYFVWGVRV
ncbi:MAG: class I SAM-dependent methyltransferase [Candidatus Omnitrophota bacterium]|nr:class I SAM-dependent methyltransferase [Candidatus Omnitrophota bacterium]